MAFERIGVRAVIEGLRSFDRDARIIERRLKQVTRSVDETADSSQRASKSFDDLAGDLVIVGAAFSAVGAAGTAFLFSSTRLAARVETLGVVTATLGRNIGKTEQEIRDLEQAVISQGITLQGSRQAIALMIQSNIDLANSTDLARLAQNAAVIANVNSTEAFERLVFVITSGNVRMARTLGLQVSFQKAYVDTAASLGKTSLELTEFEKVQARTNAVLAAGVNITGAYEAAMETAGKRALSLDRFVEEARREIGEQFVPAFGAAVDIATEALKAFDELDERFQRLIGSGILVASTTGTVVGGLALATVAVGKLGGALGTLGAAIGVSAGALGLMALAIGAVVAAGLQLISFISDLLSKIRQLKKIIGDHTEEVIRSADSYNDYRKEIERVNEVIDQQGILGELLADRIHVLSEEEFNAAREALIWRDAQEGVSEALEGSETAAADAAGEFDAMAEAERKAREEAEKLAEAQRILKEKLDEVQLTISTDVSRQFEDFQERLEELRGSLSELVTETFEARGEIELGESDEFSRLQERIADLSKDLEIARLRMSELGEETSEASRLAAQSRIDDLTRQIAEARGEQAALTGETAESLAELEAEYQEKREGIVKEIDEVTKAWRRQTAEIIFNLATQRLGLDGFTKEEIDALTTLAGPEGLGLIDETAVALLESLDELSEAMALPGDQAPLVSDALARMADAMADPMQTIEEMAEAIRDIGAAAVETAEKLTLTPGGRLPFPGTLLREHGGPVNARQPVIVGERGPELFMPRQSGNIIPNLVSAIRNAIPMAAPPAFAMAGGGSATTNNFNQTINTSAPREPIIADFNLLALIGRRGVT